MDTTTRLHHDFKEFLKLLWENEIEYLLVGGYAVSFYGYPRPTGDLDIWISRDHTNAEKITSILIDFGFGTPYLKPDLFTLKKSIVRMGFAPFKLEIITHIDGVKFDDCYHNRTEAVIDGVSVNMIRLADLLKNKKASGRAKDLNDLENLPKP